MDFLYKKHPKGTYEYAVYKRKADIIVTLILFALALGLYITGRIATGSNKNMLTIVAVLGLLPASKMVVEVIMSFKVHPCNLALKEKLDKNTGALCGLYNMYFTSYEKNFGFAHMVVTKNAVLCYATENKVEEKAFQKHLTDLLKKEGIKDTLIKVFYNEEKYIKRLIELNNLEDTEVNLNILRVVMEVTL